MVSGDRFRLILAIIIVFISFIFLFRSPITGLFVGVGSPSVVTPSIGSFLPSERFNLNETDGQMLSKTIACAPAPCSSSMPLIFEWEGIVPSDARIGEAVLAITHKSEETDGDVTLRAEVSSVNPKLQLGRLNISNELVTQEFDLSQIDVSNLKLTLWYSLESESELGLSIHMFDSIQLRVKYYVNGTTYWIGEPAKQQTQQPVQEQVEVNEQETLGSPEPQAEQKTNPVTSPKTIKAELSAVGDTEEARTNLFEGETLKIKLSGDPSSVAYIDFKTTAGYGVAGFPIPIILDENGNAQYSWNTNSRFTDAYLLEIEDSLGNVITKERFTINAKTTEKVEKLKEDKEFAAVIDSTEIEGSNLIVTFHHDASTPQPISVFGKVDWSLDKNVSSAGESVVLTVNNWNKKYFQIKVGAHSDVIAFGVPEERVVSVNVTASNGSAVSVQAEIVDSHQGSTAVNLSEHSMSATIEEGVYDIKIKPQNKKIKEIVFEDVEVFDNVSQSMGLEEPADKAGFIELYSIDPTNANFTTATVKVTATGNELFKCKDWNFTTQTCYGSWTLFKSGLVPGQEYNFTLTADDPGFGEGFGTFSENWESGSLSTNDWQNTGSGSDWYISSEEYSGTYAIEAKNTDAESIIETTVNTTGYENVTLEFYAQTKKMESGEYIAADWYNGTAWKTLVETNSFSSYTYQSFTLSQDAEDNELLKIRFRCLNNKNNERCRIDNVLMSGIDSTNYTPPLAECYMNVSVIKAFKDKTCQDVGSLTFELIPDILGNRFVEVYDGSTLIANEQITPADKTFFVDMVGVGNEIDIYVINESFEQRIHTSCSRPLDVGLVYDEFLLIDGVFTYDQNKNVTDEITALDGSFGDIDKNKIFYVVFNQSLNNNDSLFMYLLDSSASDIYLCNATQKNCVSPGFGLKYFDGNEGWYNITVANLLSSKDRFNIDPTKVKFDYIYAQKQISCPGEDAPNLTIEKTDYPDPVAVGGLLNYTITINNGDQPVYDAFLIDSLSVNTTYVSSEPAAVSGHGLVIGLGNLTPFQEVAVNITVRTDPDLPNQSIFNNIANLTYFATPNCLSDDDDDDEVTCELLSTWDEENTTVLRVPPQATLTKSDLVDPVGAGDFINYVINFTNGNQTIYDAILIEHYPAQTYFIESEPEPLNSTNNLFYVGNISPYEVGLINVTIKTAAGIANQTELLNCINISYRIEPGCLVDEDNDGYADEDDNCPCDYNPGQDDDDDDGYGNSCDDDNDDNDDDGVDDSVDNCPWHYNPSQDDDNDDGEGDACDQHNTDNDDDGDGWRNWNDNCPHDPNSGQDDDDNDDYGDQCDKFDNDQCKIEGASIGQVGAQINYGGWTVTFTSWTQKSGEPGEYVGFTYTSDQQRYYEVKAGTQKFVDNTYTWMHPNGHSGNAISYVDFCPDVDTDDDGVDDRDDNCPFDYNPDQADDEGDGIGDACDDDPNQALCAKYILNACETTTVESCIDSDGDEICDDDDNCVDVFNPGQDDDDNDGQGNACEDDCVWISFENDKQGNQLLEGTVISINLSNVTVYALNNNPSHPDKAIIFNSSDPTGGDDDLGTPNEEFGGPGIGTGGSAGSPFKNNFSMRNLLIIAENDVDGNGDGLVDVPDDEASGGVITFVFDVDVNMSSVRFVDAESTSNKIETFDQDNVSQGNITILNSGNNGLQKVFVNRSNVTALKLHLVDSTGVDNFYFCPSPPEEKPNLTIIKTDYPDPVLNGSYLYYYLNITNIGNADAINANLTDIYPSGLVFLSGVPNPHVSDNLWFFNLTQGSSYSVNITSRPSFSEEDFCPVNESLDDSNITEFYSDSNFTESLVINNTAVVSWNPTNSGSENTTVLLPLSSMMEIVKTDNPDPVDNGSLLSYTITVNYTGTTKAKAVRIYETYDENVTFVNASPAPTSGNFKWGIGNLLPGETWQVNITVRVDGEVDDGTILHNKARVTYKACKNWYETNTTENTTVTVSDDPHIYDFIATPEGPVIYEAANTYRWMMKATDPDGVSEIIFSINGANYTYTEGRVTNLGDTYFSPTLRDLDPGIYPIQWFANDTLGFNATYNFTYVVLYHSYDNPLNLKMDSSEIAQGEGLHINVNYQPTGMDNITTSDISSLRTLIYKVSNGTQQLLLNTSNYDYISSGIFDFGINSSLGLGSYVAVVTMITNESVPQTLESAINFKIVNNDKLETSVTWYWENETVVVDALFMTKQDVPINNANCTISIIDQNQNLVISDPMEQISISGITHYVYNSTSLEMGSYFGHVLCLRQSATAGTYTETQFTVKNTSSSSATDIVNRINSTKNMIQEILERQFEFSREEVFLITDSFNEMNMLMQKTISGEVDPETAELYFQSINQSLFNKLPKLQTYSQTISSQITGSTTTEIIPKKSSRVKPLIFIALIVLGIIYVERKKKNRL